MCWLLFDKMWQIFCCQRPFAICNLIWFQPDFSDGSKVSCYVLNRHVVFLISDIRDTLSDMSCITVWHCDLSLHACMCAHVHFYHFSSVWVCVRWSVAWCLSVTARTAVSVQQKTPLRFSRPSPSRLWKLSSPNYMIHQASNSPYSSQMTFTNYSFLFLETALWISSRARSCLLSCRNKQVGCCGSRSPFDWKWVSNRTNTS